MPGRGIFFAIFIGTILIVLLLIWFLSTRKKKSRIRGICQANDDCFEGTCRNDSTCQVKPGKQGNLCNPGDDTCEPGYFCSIWGYCLNNNESCNVTGCPNDSTCDTKNKICIRKPFCKSDADCLSKEKCNLNLQICEPSGKCSIGNELIVCNTDKDHCEKESCSPGPLCQSSTDCRQDLGETCHTKDGHSYCLRLQDISCSKDDDCHPFLINSRCSNRSCAYGALCHPGLSCPDGYYCSAGICFSKEFFICYSNEDCYLPYPDKSENCDPVIQRCINPHP